MALGAVLYTLFVAFCLRFAAASPSPPDLTVRAYNAPGDTLGDTYRAIRRGLASAQLEKRSNLTGNTTLDRSWDGAVLLKFGLSQGVPTNNGNSSVTVSEDVEIVCTTCYVKGVAKVELNIPPDFNATDALETSVDAVRDEVGNFTGEVVDYFVNYTKQVVQNFDDGIDVNDFAMPTFNYSFDVDIPDVPEVTLNFQFDGMELYLQLQTILGAGAEYELNLFTSNTPVGIGFGDSLMLGVVFKVDLILSVDGTIDISSGFHIKLDDGIALDIALFGQNVSNIAFPGGKFEFLPVTVQSAGVVMAAVLRIGIHSGVQISTPDTGPQFTIFDTQVGFPKASGGIEVGVYANIAEFTTNVTLVPNDPECELKVVQEYQLALGATAGASVAIDTHTWGPVAETSIPIFNTALAEACVIKGSSTPSSGVPTITPVGRKREDLTTTTISTEITHTGVVCMSSTTGNCPVSLQSTTRTVETRSLVTAVPSGEDASFPQSVRDTVTNTVAFGTGVKDIVSTSGSPTSYTPPPTPSATGGGNGNGNGIHEALSGEVGGVSKKVIVGVSVGVGVPVLAAVLVGLMMWWRRRKTYAVVPQGATPLMVAEPYAPHGKKTAGVSVTEVPRR